MAKKAKKMPPKMKKGGKLPFGMPGMKDGAKAPKKKSKKAKKGY